MRWLVFSNRPKVLYFKDSVPTGACIVLSLFFAMVFQFNGGVFLPAALQMSSALGCIQEDVTMAGYASFIGMTVIFPILFRLKSRFTTRMIFMVVCPVLIACNLMMLHVENIYVMIGVCFVSGFFRMWGTFECFSNIRLSVTPSGNFSVFYPVIYIVVLESIQLSGLVTIQISDWANWRYMHWFVIGMLACVALCVFPDQACPDAAENASLRNRLAGRGALGSGAVLCGVCLYLWGLLRLAGQCEDTCGFGDCRGTDTGQHQPDAPGVPPLYFSRGVRIPSFPYYSGLVSGTVSVPDYRFGIAGTFHEIDPEL